MLYHLMFRSDERSFECHHLSFNFFFVHLSRKKSWSQWFKHLGSSRQWQQPPSNLLPPHFRVRRFTPPTFRFLFLFLPLLSVYIIDFIYLFVYSFVCFFFSLFFFVRLLVRFCLLPFLLLVLFFGFTQCCCFIIIIIVIVIIYYHFLLLYRKTNYWKEQVPFHLVLARDKNTRQTQCTNAALFSFCSFADEQILIFCYRCNSGESFWWWY